MKTNNKLWLYLSMISRFLLVFIFSCNKEIPSKIPVLSTKSPFLFFITTNTAVSGGTIVSDGGSPVITKGVCWDTLSEPDINDDKQVDKTKNSDYTCDISRLYPGTKYFVRAYATNSIGTGYGNQIEFATDQENFDTIIVFNPDLIYSNVSDIDGNIYKTIKIDTMIWMAENLKTTKYNDGTAIPLVAGGSAWRALITPGYCWYNNRPAIYKSNFGALYNWFAVNTGKLCPVGWHVATNDEWLTLLTYLGGPDVAGSKLKESGTAHWTDNSIETTNSSGFTALPGGQLTSQNFIGCCLWGKWWTATEYSYFLADIIIMGNGNNVLAQGNSINNGLSVRCLRDN